MRDYDWDKKQYWLADLSTKKRVAGPFKSSFAALDHAAAMRRDGS